MNDDFKTFKKIDKLENKDIKSLTKEDIKEYLWALRVSVRYFELYQEYDKVSILYGVLSKLIKYGKI